MSNRNRNNPENYSETPKLSRTQINLAAKLYSLSLIAHYDAGGAETDDEDLVINKAIDEAYDKIKSMGFSPAELITLQDCIVKASQFPFKFPYL